jgi:tetratricopeptide (TPR) repeat protein
MRSAPRLEDSLAAAIERREAGDLVGALHRLERLTEEGAGEARVQLEAGRTLLLLGLPGHAADRLDRAAELDPGLPRLGVERGQAAARRGRLEEARLRFEHAVEASPTTRAFVELARTLRLLGNPERALELLETSAGAADEGEDDAAEALEERALALVSLGRLDRAVPILHELVAAGGRADNVWRAALVLAARKRFDDAEQLFQLCDAPARRHARDLVFYFRRRDGIRAAHAAFDRARDRAATNRKLRMIDLEPVAFEEEAPLDSVDLARTRPARPSKWFTLDDEQDDVRYRKALIALRERVGASGEVPFRYGRPICFQYLVPDALLLRDGAQFAVVGRDGALVSELVPDERFPSAVGRFAVHRRVPATTLELAFVTPLFGWQNHFQTLVHVLPTLAIYRRLNLTCPVVVPGPPSALQSEVIAASGISPDAAILPAEEIAGASIELAVCPGSESSGRLLREWADGVLRHVQDDESGKRHDGVLYISRGANRRRVLVNEAELEERLRATWGASVTRMEELTFREQIGAVRSASVVVAPHGAGLANLLFARPDAVIVELVPDRYPNANYARLAANARRLYVSLTGTVEEARTADDLPWRIDVGHVDAALERILRVP